jgi:hypothetical protein
MDDGFEAVHEVIDYCDGPRSGFADFKGKPHWFCAVGWSSPSGDNETERNTSGFDPHEDRFQLAPVSNPNGSRALATGTFRFREAAPDLQAGQARLLEVRWQPYGCVFIA